MYLFKKELKKEYLQGRTSKHLTDTIGLTQGYFSNILNGKMLVPKVTAYAITKAGNENAKIQDYFIKKRE